MTRRAVVSRGLVLPFYLLAQIARSAPGGQTAAPSSPEVVLLGTAHDLHFKAESHYSLADLRSEVAELHPDLICSEIRARGLPGADGRLFPSRGRITG